LIPRCGPTRAAWAERTFCNWHGPVEVAIYDTIEEFYCAEALEYIRVWQQATATIRWEFGPIGTDGAVAAGRSHCKCARHQAQDAHFWGMTSGSKTIGWPSDHRFRLRRPTWSCVSIAFVRTFRCREEHPFSGGARTYSQSYDEVRCLLMQGGQGEVKHWAFNDPPKREGQWKDEPPPPENICS